MRMTRSLILANFAAGAALLIAAPAFADALLSGTIKSADGKPMGGITVSAKSDGGTITTTVFTDKSGQYFFPALPAGHYRVWAQALSFKTAKGEVDLSANRKQDFSLDAMNDAEATFKQLPGNLVLDALPADTPEQQRMKRIVGIVCTGCHTPSFPLQNRFDEAGWNAIVGLMKNVNVYGTYLGPEHKPSGILDFHQKELAAYLAAARGPGKSDMTVKLEPRPSGESARVVFKEYDLPLDPDANLPADFVQNDGSDWSKGTPSVLIPGWGVHDAWLDLTGNLWFTCNVPNKRTTIGHIDTATGTVKLFRISGPRGLAAATHGMTRDPHGILWFNINNGRGGLGRLDPATQKITVYLPPVGMTQTGGAATVDYDGKGDIWSSAPDGALRFDPVAEKFTEFKSKIFKTPNGTGITYGTAADRDGNGYWAEMILDTIGVGDGRTGAVSEIKLAPVKAQEALLTPEERKFYATYTTSPTSTIRCRGPKVRGAWAPTRTPTSSGSAIHGATTSPASTRVLGRSPMCRCRARNSPTTSLSTRITTPGPTCGAPIASCVTTRVLGRGPHRFYRPAAPSRVTSRCSNALARTPRSPFPISAPARWR